MSMGTLATLGIVVFGVVVLVSSIALRAADQCRRRVTHARIAAQARRIEEIRREQIMQRLSTPSMGVLPGLRDDG